MTALTAAFALFYILELPASWQHKPQESTPLLIYGASTAVGAFAIKLAVASAIHPIVVIGSSRSEFVTSLLQAEDGDTFLDYTHYKKHHDLANAIKHAFSEAGVPEGRTPHALDAVSVSGTFDAVVSQAMAGEPIDGRKPRIAVVNPGTDYSTADPSVEIENVFSGLASQGGDVGKRFAYVSCRLFSLGLSEGWLTPHPYEVREEGLNALSGALRESIEGKIKAKKILLRIAQTD